MKTYIASNFNLMRSNGAWDELLNNHRVQIGNFNDVIFSLQNEKILNEHDVFVCVLYLNDYNFQEIKEIEKIINKNAKKFPETIFLLKIFTLKHQNLDIDNSNNRKKISLTHNLIKKKHENIFIFFYQDNQDLFSLRNNFIIRCPLSQLGLQILSNDIKKNIKLIIAKPFKLIILDCDNTLWGGVIGEDGIDKIRYGEDGEGKIFEYVQKILKSLKLKGFLLSIASKNNEELVWETMKKREMHLQKKDFLFSKINWKRKDMNIKKTLSQINIKSEDVLFVDDSPVERELVKKTINKIYTLDSSDLENYLKFLLENERLQKLKTTKEDKKKYSQYNLKNKFEDQKKDFAGTDDKNFFKELRQKITFHRVESSNISRAEQLFNKTNQFNFTSNRYNQKDIKKILKKNNQRFELFSLKDKFGDHGIIGLVIYTINQKNLLVTDFLLSCRVISRKIEEFIILKLLQKNKVNEIKILYNQNNKNKTLIKKFLDENNFKIFKNKFLLRDIIIDKKAKIYCLKTNKELEKFDGYFKK